MRRTIAVVPATFIPDPTRIPELWLLGEGHPPLAIGPLSADRTVVIALPSELADKALADKAKGNAALAVSLELPDASLKDGPKGPVIGKGTLTNL